MAWPPATTPIRNAGLVAREAAAKVSSRLRAPFQGASLGATSRDDEDLLRLLPGSLRPTDPTLFSQARTGVVRIGGASLNIGDATPFDVTGVDAAARHTLHSFTWLHDLRAAGNEDAHEMARDWTIAWLKQAGGRDAIARDVAVTARRVMSWLSHADILLEDVDHDVWDAVLASLETDVRVVARRWPEVASPDDRLAAILAFLAGTTALPRCGAPSEAARTRAANAAAEIVLEDGSHITRNPANLIGFCLDAIPIQKACDAIGLPLPAQVNQRIQAALCHLRMMRHANAELARFNGVSTTPRAQIGRLFLLVAALDDPGRRHQSGGYIRLVAGQTSLIADVGPTPAPSHALHAHAGALSFELMAGTTPVIINAGAPAANCAIDRRFRDQARGTAAHSTLVLANKASANLAHEGSVLAGIAKGQPVHGVGRMPCDTHEHADGTLEATAAHDGYAKAFGLRHTRTWRLAPNGESLSGTDRISAHNAGLPVRLATDLPVAIHFHLAPGAAAKISAEGSAVLITLPDGDVWELSTPNAEASVERSTYFADAAAPIACEQIVLRCTTHGETTVNWRLAKRAHAD